MAKRHEGPHTPVQRCTCSRAVRKPATDLAYRLWSAASHQLPLRRYICADDNIVSSPRVPGLQQEAQAQQRTDATCDGANGRVEAVQLAAAETASAERYVCKVHCTLCAAGTGQHQCISARNLSVSTPSNQPDRTASRQRKPQHPLGVHLRLQQGQGDLAAPDSSRRRSRPAAWRHRLNIF